MSEQNQKLTWSERFELLERTLEAEEFDKAVQISESYVNNVRRRLRSLREALSSANTPSPESWKLLKPIWDLDIMLGFNRGYFSHPGQDKYLAEGIFAGTPNGIFVRDADMAKEITLFTRNQIVFKSATAMLAQANQVPRSILTLLS